MAIPATHSHPKWYAQVHIFRAASPRNALTPLFATCRDSLLLKAVRRDEGLELEVADPKDEVGEGEARKTEGEDELKLERLQCR